MSRKNRKFIFHFVMSILFFPFWPLGLLVRHMIK